MSITLGLQAFILYLMNTINHSYLAWNNPQCEKGFYLTDRPALQTADCYSEQRDLFKVAIFSHILVFCSSYVHRAEERSQQRLVQSAVWERSNFIAIYFQETDFCLWIKNWANLHYIHKVNKSDVRFREAYSIPIVSFISVHSFDTQQSGFISVSCTCYSKKEEFGLVSISAYKICICSWVCVCLYGATLEIMKPAFVFLAFLAVSQRLLR